MRCGATACAACAEREGLDHACGDCGELLCRRCWGGTPPARGFPLSFSPSAGARRCAECELERAEGEDENGDENEDGDITEAEAQEGEDEGGGGGEEWDEGVGSAAGGSDGGGGGGGGGGAGGESGEFGKGGRACSADRSWPAICVAERSAGVGSGGGSGSGGSGSRYS